MASFTKSTTKLHQNTRWCTSHLGMLLNAQGYAITGFNHCKFGVNCYNAHKMEDIEKKPLIVTWERINDFSKFNLGAIMDNILDIMDKSKQLVNDQKYRSGIAIAHSLNFTELLKFWFDIACHHRRIAHQLPSKRKWHDKSLPLPIDMYHYQEDVPQFYLENEDNIWALERVLHMCPSYEKLTKTRRSNMNEICCNAFNCKNGVHDIKDLVCVSNLLTGECTCMSDVDIDVTATQITEDIKKLETMLCTSTDADGFQIRLSRKLRDEINAEIRDKKHELMTIPPRMRHLTEHGLIPLKVHLDKKAEIAKKVEEAIEKVEATKKITKKRYT